MKTYYFRSCACTIHAHACVVCIIVCTDSIVPLWNLYYCLGWNMLVITLSDTLVILMILPNLKVSRINNVNYSCATIFYPGNCTLHFLQCLHGRPQVTELISTHRLSPPNWLWCTMSFVKRRTISRLTFNSLSSINMEERNIWMLHPKNYCLHKQYV